jgi:hypothetical protein
MKMTREKHLDYMVKMAPFLLAAVVIQSYIYSRFFEPALARDIGILLAIGTSLILGAFYAHDHFHQVLLKDNYLHIQVKPLKYQEEILYRNITGYQVKNSRHGYGNVTLHLKEGHSVNIYYLDDVEGFIQTIKKKQVA